MKNNRHWLSSILATSIMLPASLLANDLPNIHDLQKGWAQFEGDISAEYPRGTAVDPNGDIYIVGYTLSSEYMGYQSAGSADIFISKYDADGNRLWTDLYGSTESDRAMGVAVSSAGLVYVVGYTEGDLDGNTHLGGTYDAFLSIYDKGGRRLVTTQYGTSYNDQAYAVAIDDANEAVYVAGETDGTMAKLAYGGDDALVSKFSLDGNYVASLVAGSSSNEAANAIAVDGSGNVHVSGNSFGDFDGHTNNGGNDIFYITFTSAGTKVSSALYGTDQSDLANGIAIDGYGDTYIVGETSGDMDGTNAGYSDIVLLKIAAEGDSWVRQIGTSNYDQGYAVTTDADNDIYLTGRVYDSFDGNTAGGGYDAILTKYRRDGTRLWSKQFGGTGLECNYAIASTSDGNIVTLGHTGSDFEEYTRAGSYDNMLLQYTPVGTKIVHPSGSDASVGDYDATDIDGDSVTFGVSGTDASTFVIDPSTGVLNFADTPQTTAPGDSNGDNVYEIEVTASDTTGSSSLPLQITVEAPELTRETPSPNPSLIMYLLN